MAKPKSLYEEFQRLGLISEDEVELAKESEQPTAAEIDDLFDEDEDADYDYDYDAEDEDDDLDEAMRVIVTREGKKKRVRKATGAERREMRLASRKRRRTAAGRKSARKFERRQERFERTARAERVAALRKKVHQSGTDAADSATEDRLDVLMGELDRLSAKFAAPTGSTVAESQQLREHLLAQRIYANIARISDALCQRLDESDTLYDTLDRLANDSLRVAEAIQAGEVMDMDRVIEAIPGYVKDLVGAVGEISEELDAELAFETAADEYDEGEGEDYGNPW